MRNIIKIDVFGVCSCSLVANINDWTNGITIMFENDAFNSPVIEMTVNGTTTTEQLTVVNGVAIYDFPFSIFSTTVQCQFRFVDGDKIGSWFTMRGIDGGTIPLMKTLKVVKLGNYDFRAALINQYDTPVSSYNPDDFTVSDDGELSLKDDTETKTVTKIIATDKGGKVTNVRVQYSDDTETSNDCTYDKDTGKLIKFGTLPIDWSYITE